MNAPTANDCFKCLGRGVFENLAHVQSGVCFACNGTGKLAYRNRPTHSRTVKIEYTRAQLIEICARSLRILDEYASPAERLQEIDDQHGVSPARIAAILPADVRARYASALAKLGVAI